MSIPFKRNWLYWLTLRVGGAASAQIGYITYGATGTRDHALFGYSSLGFTGESAPARSLLITAFPSVFPSTYPTGATAPTGGAPLIAVRFSA